MGLGGAEGTEVSGLASWVKSEPLWRQEHWQGTGREGGAGTQLSRVTFALSALVGMLSE